MKNKITFLVKVVSVTSGMIFLCGVLILYPQLYSCKNTLRLGQYKIYFCEKKKSDYNDVSINSMVLKADELLRKSDIFDPNLRFKIFVRSNNHQCLTLPWQFSQSAYGQTIPLFYNIYISNVNLAAGTAFNGIGHNRPLSSVLAHELTHVLFENKFGWVRTRFYPWVDKKSQSQLGLFWKEEGYAEYIASGQGINMKEGLKILNGKPNSYYTSYEIEYFKCWLAIKYLIDVKHLSIDQIVALKIDLDTVLQQAMSAANQFK